MLGEANGRCGRGATRNSYQKAFFLGQTQGHFDRLLIGDLLHAIDHGEIEILGNEASADALNFVWAWLESLTIHGLGDHRAVAWLNGNRGDGLALLLLDVTRDTGDGAPGANAGNKDIDRSIAVIPDLRTCGLLVDLWVGGIIKLPRHEVLGRIAIGNFLGLSDGARHALGGFRENQFGAKHGHHPSPFDRHRFRHREDQLVTTSRGSEGQGNACVA